MPVSVLDRKGRPVIDMKQSEFRVYENNKLQTIKRHAVLKPGATESRSRSDCQCSWETQH
jgi:hypothetical protein